jgi:hypothetical protein
MLGKLVFEKGRMYLKDDGLLSGINADILKPCWDKGLIGMICNPKDKDWESLTFYGLEKCKLPADLESTRHGFLVAAQNQYGDKLIDFSGSVYRGFNLMLENHFLPVVLLTSVTSIRNDTGLAVTDLRTAPMPISLIQTIHGKVSDQIDFKQSMTVQDTSLNSGDFDELFKQYLGK